MVEIEELKKDYAFTKEKFEKMEKEIKQSKSRWRSVDRSRT
jgi:predicted  nucleic acid-binding Zn-ribbon protein